MYAERPGDSRGFGGAPEVPVPDSIRGLHCNAGDRRREAEGAAGESGLADCTGNDCATGIPAPRLGSMTATDRTQRDKTASAPLARRRRRDLARVLPVAGAVLLVSPLLNVVAGGGAPFGIPAGVVYVFGVWGGLILGTGLLARRLREDGDDG
jgi:hypothetical protein